MNRFQQVLDAPLATRSRWLLAALVVALLFSYSAPLWRIFLVAPQYPEGLTMEIWSYKVEGGNDGHDIKEINTLNHYIGMHPIDETALRDLDWIPYALALLALWALRVATIGNVRSLVDLAVLSLFVTGVSVGRFVYMLYSFGHNLDPRAPVNVEPFMPVVIGTKQIANFTTSSYPLAGTVFLMIFVLGVVAIAGWHLFRKPTSPAPKTEAASPALESTESTKETAAAAV